MTRKTALASFIALVVAACASAPSGPPPLDPVGVYAYQASAEGMVIAGTMTIQQNGDGYGGQISSDMIPPIAISGVEVTGQNMTIQASGPEGALVVEMAMAGTAFEGTWTMGAMSGTFTGTKQE